MESAGTITKQQYEKDLLELKRKYKPNNAFSVPVESQLDFYRWWCVFLRPFINLTDRERDVVASFLYHREELAKTITDPTVLDTMLRSEGIKNQVIADCGISKQHFYVVIGSLKKKGVMQDNVISPKLIPNKNEDGVFKLMILFKSKD